MKRIAGILLFLILISPLLKAQSPMKEVDLVKKAIQDSFQEILSDLNPQKVPKFYAPDFLLLENGEVWNNDTIVNYLKKASRQEEKPERQNTFDFIDVKIKGDVAWVSYHNEASFLVEKKQVRRVRWLESAVLIREEGRWKLHMLHSSKLFEEKSGH